MAYRLVSLEITDPLFPIHLTDEEEGVALFLKWQGVPAGFVLRPSDPGSTVSALEIEEWIRRAAYRDILSVQVDAALCTSQPAEDLPRISIVICTHERPDLLERCLSSIQQLQKVTTCDEEVEVIVVDNAPETSRTRQITQQFPGVQYTVEPRTGLDFARNRGLKEANGDIIAYLDDDVVVDPGWLRGLYHVYGDNPDAAAFTGLVLPLMLETKAQVLFELNGGFRRGFQRLRYKGQTLTGNPLYPVGAGIFGAGANMAFRREVLLQLGGFDEALDTGAPLPGGGDLDMFYRIIRSGHALVYEPTFLVYHEHRKSLDALRRQYWSWGLGFMAFLTKTYRTDPTQRGKVREMLKWWFKDRLKELIKSLAGDHVLPYRMIHAELWGGVQGLLGEYDRSEKRVARIRERIGNEPDLLTETSSLER